MHHHCGRASFLQFFLLSISLAVSVAFSIQCFAQSSSTQEKPKDDKESQADRSATDFINAIKLDRSWMAKWRLYESSLWHQTAQTTPTTEAQNQAAPGTGDLQKAVQNPVANLISVPLQNNTDFDIGPFGRTRNTLNIQPVIPFKLSDSVMMITRTIFPVIIQPDVSTPNLDTFGLGDLNPTFFFSPAKPGKLIWGLGPSFLLPTATDRVLGTGKWSAGPSLVALVQPGKWTLGALVSNLWSFAGQKNREAVNSMTLQYFVNHNFSKGWFLTLQPIITANWRAADGDKWLVPFGGGFGRVFAIGTQPMNAGIQLYYNAIRPDTLPSPRWQLRMQLSLLYPQRR